RPRLVLAPVYTGIDRGAMDRRLRHRPHAGGVVSGVWGIASRGKTGYLFDRADRARLSRDLDDPSGCNVVRMALDLHIAGTADGTGAGVGSLLPGREDQVDDPSGRTQSGPIERTGLVRARRSLH